MNRLTLLTLAIFLAPMAAFADGAAAPLVDSTAPPTCKKPIPPSALRKADGDTDFQENYTVYQQCIKDYMDAQNNLAKLHVDAANAAAIDANAFAQKINEAQSNKQ